MKTGSVAPAIAAAIEKLEINEYTDLIQTKNGYMILRLMERFSPGVPKFEEVESHVQGDLVQPAHGTQAARISDPTSQRKLHFSSAGIH